MAIRVSAILLAAGAILWNGWVLGWLNHGLAGYTRMSISGLGVPHQPHAALFNLLEYASGVCMVAGGLGVTLIFRRRALLVLMALAVALIGVLTIYDVEHPLDCNAYRNPACVARARSGQVSYTEKLHDAESRITAYVTIVLAALVVIWAYTSKLARGELVLALVLLVVIAASLAMLDLNSHIVANAVAERVWNTLVSLDIIIIALRLPVKFMLSRDA